MVIVNNALNSARPKKKLTTQHLILLLSLRKEHNKQRKKLNKDKPFNIIFLSMKLTSTKSLKSLLHFKQSFSFFF